MDIKRILAQYNGIPYPRFRRVVSIPVAWLPNILDTEVARKAPAWAREQKRAAVGHSRIDMNIEPLRAIEKELNHG